jgi:hypothetical protein
MLPSPAITQVPLDDVGGRTAQLAAPPCDPLLTVTLQLRYHISETWVYHQQKLWHGMVIGADYPELVRIIYPESVCQSNQQPLYLGTVVGSE